MSRFNNNRGGLGMNNFQPRRGAGPIGPMRGGIMGHPHYRSHPFQHPNQNRRGHNNFNNRPNQGQKPSPQKPQQSQSAPVAASPAPAPAQQKPEETKPTPPVAQAAQPALKSPPQPPAVLLSQEKEAEKIQQPKTAPPQPSQPPPSGPKPGQQPGPRPGQQGQKPAPPQPQKPSPPQPQKPVPQQTPKPGPQQTPKPVQQGQKPIPQQSPKPGPQQSPKPAPQQQQQQGQKPGPQQSPKPGATQGQRPPGPPQGQRPVPPQQQQQGQRPGAPQGQRPGQQQQQGPKPGPPQGQKTGAQQSRFSGPSGQKPAFHPEPVFPQEQKPIPGVSGAGVGRQGEGFKATLSMLLKPGEKPYTQRCRLFVGNLPNDITEEYFKKMFAKYGEPSEVFINKAKGFGFIRLESRALAEIAKAELDDTPMRNRPLRVRFATHSAALSVKNLSPCVTNELLEEAFSQFGVIERAVVIVDDRGRSVCKGIVEFASRIAARKALDRCNEGVFLLTSCPRPVVVEPLEQYDTEDGLPEKLAQKNPKYQAAREEPPRFARPGTFEFEYAKRWKSLDEMEKQQREQVEKNMREAREKLESEMEDAFHEHQANLLRQELLRRQEELRRMEEMHTQEMQKRKEMQLRQEEERRRREEEMLRKREMEEQIRRQREESYRMGNFMDRDREMRMHSSGALGIGDMPFGGANQNFQVSGLGFDAQQAMNSSAAGLMGGEMLNERFAQGTPRGMGPAAAGYGRVREEFDGPIKKPRF